MKEDIREKLRQIPLFEQISQNEESVARLEEITRVIRVPAGRIIIEEGDVGSEMYIARTGSVEIRKKTRAGDDYTVVKLNAHQNVFFGELALVDDDRRSATVIATEDSELIVITKEDFLRLGDSHPDIGLPITRVIAKILAGRLRKTTGDMLTIFDALVNELQP